MLNPINDGNKLQIGKYELHLLEERDFGSRGLERDLAFDIAIKLDDLADELKVLYRAVEIDSEEKLKRIESEGVDVVPTDDTIYCSHIASKVLEDYVKRNSVIMIFDWNKLRSTWQEIPMSSSQEKIDEIQKTYPYRYDDKKRGYIVLSRFSRNNSQMFSLKEREECYWIPGNSKEALLGLVIVKKA